MRLRLYLQQKKRQDKAVDPYLLIEFQSLLVIRRVGPSSRDTFAEMLERARQFCASSVRPISYVYDGGPSAEGHVDAASRQYAAKWVSENEALLRARCKGMDFAISNPISRGALTAVLWLRSPPVDVKVHADLLAATKAGIERLSLNLDPAQVVREVEAQIARRSPQARA